MPRLTEYHRRHIINLLERGEAIPPDFKHLLFPPEKQEYELVYAGKEREEDILAETMAVPLQAVKAFGNGDEGEWHNMLIFGDNLQVMKTLLQMKEKGELVGADGTLGVRLVYIDPPFATKREMRGKQDEIAYQDRVAGAQFIEFLRKRLVFLRDLLASDGSIFVHLDYRKGHYIKAIMDEVFGERNFESEIIWKRSAAHSDAATFATIHDTLLFYTRTRDFAFNNLYQPYDQDYVDERYKHTDPDGRRYMDDNLTAMGLKGGGYEYEWKGITKVWRCPPETMERYEQEDRLYYTRNGVARIKRYLDEMPGLALQDIWLDISPVNSQAEERVDYPTQKPETLLERIISACSNPGDIVLDAFAGSGTALAVAEKMRRRWVGIDCGKLAIYTVQERMLGLYSRVGSAQTDTRKTFDLIEHKDQISKSSGAMVVTERARKGQLEVNSQLLQSLANMLEPPQKDFWIVCPEKKFKLEEHEIDDDGTYCVQVGETTFRFSFLQQKEKPPQPQELEPQPFTLYNAGLYDFSTLKRLPWEDWRFFALHLFQCRDELHVVSGLQLDGYRGIDDVLVFNHLQHGGVVLDHGFVDDLHNQIGSRVGSRFFIIAPAASVTFLEDYIDKDDTRYYILRIPYSIINELHTRDFEAITQPMDESQVNETVEAVGFDFMRLPRVECSYSVEVRAGELVPEAVIRLRTFESKAMVKGATLRGNLETLSMVMVDYDFDGDVFDLDAVFYATDIEKQGWEIRMPIESFGDQIMIIYMDIYGNEYRELKQPDDFQPTTQEMHSPEAVNA